MIEMFETGNGGDYVVLDSGIQLDSSLKTIVYEGLFGGNLIESTLVDRKPAGALYFDFWGNALILNDSLNQFNSTFEKKITEEPINSFNLIEYESAAEDDLKFLIEKKYASSVDATATIISVGKLKVEIIINQPSSSEPETVSFIWDQTLKKVEMLG